MRSDCVTIRLAARLVGMGGRRARPRRPVGRRSLPRSPSPPESERERIAKQLCAWFAREARDLPWRRRRTGYRALVAEAMLQQTQVSRVVDRYLAFVRRFPTLKSLAAANEQEVLAQWQGLGYYLRARSLHAAAQMIVTDFGGRVPRDAKRLRKLPGIGRYTAGAIASIVYGQREAAVDGNVRRVLARWFAKPLTDDEAWGRAESLVEAAPDPGSLNEALMELGAVICTPRAPSCERCPVSRHCRAFQRGVQENLPLPRPAARQKVVHHHAVVIFRGRGRGRDRKLLLERRPTNGLWSRMWQVPTIESERALRPAEIRRRLAIAVDGLRRHATFEHHTTHRRITFHVYEAGTRDEGRGTRRSQERGTRDEGRGTRRKSVWRRPDDVDDLPMSNAQRRILEGIGMG